MTCAVAPKGITGHFCTLGSNSVQGQGQQLVELQQDRLWGLPWKQPPKCVSSSDCIKGMRVN